MSAHQSTKKFMKQSTQHVLYYFSTFCRTFCLCRPFWKFIHRVKLRRTSCTCITPKFPECSNVLVAYFNPLPKADCSHQAQKNLKLIAFYVWTAAISSVILCLIGHLALENLPFPKEWQGKEWETFSTGCLYHAS